MPLWDQLRGLELVVEEFRTDRQSVDVSTQFTRVTTTVVLSGSGHEGRGEDVTYTAEDHDWFPEPEPPGATTLGDFSAELDHLTPFQGEPKMAASADYRRWALESAALDLALRQSGLSLGAALGLEYRPVRFVVSTRGDAFAWLAAAPQLELKLDPENEWDRPFMERLTATGRVRVLDLKAYYTGTAVDVVPDPDLYRNVVELFPDVVIEDASLEGACGDVDADSTDVVPAQLNLARMDGRPDFEAQGGQRAVEREGTAEGSGRSVKPRQHAVASRLYELAVPPLDLGPRELVVAVEQLAPTAIAQLGCACRRVDEVGEHDGREHAIGIAGGMQ